MGQTSSNASPSSTNPPNNQPSPIPPTDPPPQASIPNPFSIADSAGSQLRENLEYLHHQLMQHAGADFDIVTTTTLSYSQFLSYISKLNDMWGNLAILISCYYFKWAAVYPNNTLDVYLYIYSVSAYMG